MKIFLVLFISLSYATESPNLRDRAIEETSESRFERLNTDTFNYLMTFLDPKKVLNLKILNRGIYHRVRNLWPEMKLFTVVDVHCPGRSMGFSHILKIYDSSTDDQENQEFFYNQAQLSCLREFSLACPKIRNFQAVINLLPRNSLTSLRLHNIGFPRPLIGKIDFPKLTHLKLFGSVGLSHDTFSSLPNSMKVLEIEDSFIDSSALFSLVTALKTMDKLEVLSLYGCILPKDGISAIFENLPVSLEKLNIRFITSRGFEMKLSELGLKRLREMKRLQEINFMGVHKFAIEIILNLPECITNIVCSMKRETLDAFQQKLGRFTNLKRIYLPWMARAKLYPIIREIFPNLDEDIKKELDSIIYK